MAKPDNRADNVDHLQKSVQNTIENMREAEDYLDEHAEEISDTERETIEQKIQNRQESIAGMRREIKDEAAFQNKKS